MNTSSKLFLLAVVSLGSFTSCLKDDNRGYFTPQESWGTIHGTPEAFTIATDNGNTLNVVENRDPVFEVEDNQRVVALLTAISQTGDTNYDVQVNAMTKLLTKLPVYPSKLTEPQIDSLGTNPIEVINAWFGVGRYLDIQFQIFRDKPQIAHFLNLVVDEKRSTEEEVFVTLRHNAFGDVAHERVWGRVSFDIASLIPEGKDHIRVTLQWANYNGTQGNSSGVFKARETSKSFIVTTKSATLSGSPSAVIQ